ncbi:UNKNOWN [Stylonychia lemnae]|uniref:Uncharacterized protein n=1 Tax=Stylonychia lemnae TaxID=5949 RepID=A0A078ACN5_STYLE|nr:UNKNOWN [Stylonychia lemnae]|eukprot:CDW79342.1 UNKNOWN [Stylonychia lemnae]
MNYLQQHYPDFSQFGQQNFQNPQIDHQNLGNYPQVNSQQFPSQIHHQQQPSIDSTIRAYNNHNPSNNSNSSLLGMNSHHNSQNQALDDMRRQEILQKLQQERQMRRQFVQDGKANEFKLDTIASARQTMDQEQSNFKNEVNNSINFQNQRAHNGGYGNGALTNQYNSNSKTFDYNQNHQNNNHGSQFNSNGQIESDVSNQKQDLVHKLLNERRASRSKTSINQSHITQNSHNHSEVSPDIGGYNPEALYQEEVFQNQFELENQNNQNARYQKFNLTSQSSNNLGGTSFDDQKYRDAVEYAKHQIQQELKKKQQINQIYNNNDFVDSYPVNYTSYYNIFYYGSQPPEPERWNPSKQTDSLSKNPNIMQNYLDFANNGLPPNVKNMDKKIANNSQSKSILEMNKKNSQRSNRGQATNAQNHNFNYESEDDQKMRIGGMTGIGTGTKNLQRPQSAQFRQVENRTFSKEGRSGGPPEYMKNTVNADLKRGPQPTVNKTKQLITEAEKKFQEEHTFKPKVNDYQVPPSKEFSKEERWKKLTEPKTTEIQKRELIKAKIEQEETIKQCTFQPSITKSNKKSARKHRNKENDDIPLPERLMHEADIRKEKREKLKREVEQEQMKDCSFKPQLMAQSNSVVNVNKFGNQVPIHERVGHLQKEKNEKLQKLRMKSEQEQQDLTFHPQVNTKSAKITTVKRMEEESRPKDVVERLYQDAANKINKQMQQHESYNEQLQKDYSFQPHISKTSNYLSEKSDLFNGNLKDFYERQQAFVQKQTEKREEFRQKYSEEAKCSFKPEINVTSDIIMESDPKRGAETEDERYYRLYKKDHKRQEIVKEMIEKEVYSQYTFKPQINKISKTLAKGSSIDDLAYNPKGLQKKELLQEQFATQEVNYCTFRPETTKNKKYDKVNSTYKLSDGESLEQFSMNLKQKLKEKQEKIAKVRKEREYEVQKDCTFKPTILEKEPSTSKDQVVVVRGLGRHLELKELQKKKEEDKKLREAEVFGLNHKFAVNSEELDMTNPNRPTQTNTTQMNQTQSGAYTIPKPFDLSHTKIEKKNKLLKELNEKERSECTFKPNTNEGRNKKLINQILEENEDKENEYEYANNQDYLQQQQYQQYNSDDGMEQNQNPQQNHQMQDNHSQFQNNYNQNLNQIYNYH